MEGDIPLPPPPIVSHGKHMTKVSKAAVAREVYDEEVAKGIQTKMGITRKAVVAAIAERAGLSVKGANTYYQTIRKQRGLVTARASW